MQEVAVKKNQYGGVKGCSTSHMLLKIMQQICKNAEDYRSATVLTAIDYAKAFNRLSFQKCLAAFKKKGASSIVLRLIAAFLKDRVMTVRVNNTWSDPLSVDGGCPQGSVLGVFLFNITTDDLEDEFVEFDEDNLRNQQQHIEILPNVANIPAHLTVPPVETPVGTQALVRTPTLVFKYVDDNIICERINFGSVDAVLIGGRALKEKRAMCSENAFRSIVLKAIEKGMKVNNGKTCILCVSDNMSYSTLAYIEDINGEKIESSESLKVLGFNFENKPSVGAQISYIVKRFRQRYWSLRHLKKIGFSQSELVEVYKTNILPIADYTDVVYHSLMTDEMDERLKNAQNGALRCIFDPRLSAQALREASGLQTLRKRRIEHVDKFAQKCVLNPRFQHLFPLNNRRRSARAGEKYLEEYARCDRLRNSPLFFMRRRLNGKEGKSYGERNREFREA